jgi:serine/threonine protein kinase
MIKPGTMLQDRYLVGKQIGSGGMGAVYLAIDNRFENQVAIKETFYNDEKLSEAFEREARILNKLHHPTLPHVSDFFIEDETHFLVMEHIEGEDLSEILQNGKPLPIIDVLRWADQLLDALDYLHSQNPPIIHRDIKPHNLKITPRGDIILLDFGLAKLETIDEQEERSIFGYSRTYSPLEQIEGTGTDSRSDIFSLAATCYHLLTSHPPTTALKRAAAIFNGKSDPLEPASRYSSEISPAIDDILKTALSLDRNNRFSSANAMRTAIEYALREEIKPIIEATASENLTKSDSINLPINEIIEESINSTIPIIDFDEPPDLENKKEIQSNTQTENNRRQFGSTPFFVPVLDGRMPSIYKKVATLTLILFTLASGFIVWAFITPKNSSNEQAQTPVTTEIQTSVLPISSDKVETIPVPESEPKLLESKEISDVPEEKTNPALQDSLRPEISARKESSSVKKSIKNTSVPLPANEVSKEVKATKPAISKTTPKQNVASTNLIIVPNSGLTRPRVISKRPTPKSRESSASEINRFLIGKP